MTIHIRQDHEYDPINDGLIDYDSLKDQPNSEVIRMLGGVIFVLRESSDYDGAEDAGRLQDYLAQKPRNRI